MATLAELENALIKADEAGNVEDAKMLTQHILAMRQQQPNKTLPVGTDNAPATPEYPSFTVGVGKGMVDVGRGIGELFGGEYEQTQGDVQIERQQPMGVMAGNIAATLPTMLIPGANTIKGAALISGLTSGLTTQGDLGQRAASAGLGAVGGAVGTGVGNALPLAAKAIDRTLEPLTDKGRNLIISRLLKADIPEAELPTILGKLDSPEIFVPGTNPTAAEIAQQPHIARVQRWARSANPTEYSNVEMANALARRNALQDVAGTKGKYEWNIAQRKATTEPLYNAATSQILDIDQAMIDLLRRPSMSQGFERGQRIAAEQGYTVDKDMLARILSTPHGITPTDKLSGETIDYLKKGLDDFLKDPTSSIQKNERRAVEKTIDDFESWRAANIPEYNLAQQTYARMSQPINQYEVAQELYKRAIPARVDLGGAGENLNAYARALRDATTATDLVKTATGLKDKTIKDVMTPQQLQMLGNIGKDMTRTANVEKLGAGSNSTTAQHLATQKMFEDEFLRKKLFAGHPMVNALADIVYKGADEKIKSRLAQALLNPNVTADLIRLTDSPDFFERLVNSPRAFALSGVVGQNVANQKVR